MAGSIALQRVAVCRAMLAAEGRVAYLVAGPAWQATLVARGQPWRSGLHQVEACAFPSAFRKLGTGSLVDPVLCGLCGLPPIGSLTNWVQAHSLTNGHHAT